MTFVPCIAVKLYEIIRVATATISENVAAIAREQLAHEYVKVMILPANS